MSFSWADFTLGLAVGAGLMFFIFWLESEVWRRRR